MSSHVILPLVEVTPINHKAASVVVDGIDCVAASGELLVDVINRSGQPLPQVCYHKQLGPIQTCDTCLVEVDGKLVRACATQVSGDMNVLTESKRAKDAQREAFDRILGNHLLYCTVCDNNNGNCTVHNTTGMLKVDHQQIPFQPKPYAVDNSNSFYRYDPDQCILCGRCVEACQNLQVNETLTICWEDKHPRVLWDGGMEIAGSSCVSCGHCVSVCPCNALMEKSMLGHAGYLTSLPVPALNSMIDFVKGLEPETGFEPLMAVSQSEAAMREERVRRTKTVCTYCGVGCSFEMWTKDRHILKVEPFEGPANGVSTCVKGKFGWDYVNSDDRITQPLIRENGKFREASWDEALTLIAAKFAQLKRDHGPDSMAFITSSKGTNEESYLLQKFARAVIGTNNIDNCSRYCQTPATKGLSRTVGYGGDSGSIRDLEQAGLIIIVGSNTAEAHPVIATRIKRAHKLRGQRLIVADLRKNEMAERADIHLHPKPGTDMVWISAVTRHLIETGRARMDFIEKRVNGFDEYRKSLEPFTLDFAEKTTGIPVETLKTVADEIAKADGVCFVWAMGVTQHCGGSDTSTSMSNLLLATGNYGRPGAGAFPMRGHNNVQGASDFGSMPDLLPGYQKVDDADARARVESVWKTKIPTTKGLNNHEMIRAIDDGKLKSMFIIGEDTITSDANLFVTEAALSKIEFFVVMDLFFTKTCHFADVVLPGCPSVEKEGTFTNTERRIQRLYKVFEPLGEARPDWTIIRDLANRLGAGWEYDHPSEIMDEAAKAVPIFAGVRYHRLTGYHSLQWPVAEDGSDQPLLYTKSFPFPDGKAKFFPMEWIEPSEQPDAEYNLHVNNGRVLEHFEVGNMTYRVPGIRKDLPDTFLEISPELAAQHGIADGRHVRLESRHGWLIVRAVVTDRVQGNELYMAMNTLEYPVNRLSGSNTDRATDTPAYKEIAVRMSVLPEKGESPIPRRNFRFGQRTPQNGVEVERKWRRPDYRLPGTPLVQIRNAGSVE